MRVGGVISGRLTRRDGGPLTIGIRAESAGLYGVRWGVRANAEGNFRFEGLLPGAWWISCSTPDGARALVKDVATGTSGVSLEIGPR